MEVGGREALRGRHIVLVGMMGAGKSTVGRSLARRLDLKFVDADEAIEAAAHCSVSDIFKDYGEAEFRRLEHDVIVRLLTEPQQIIATGGGAVMNPDTRDHIRQRAVSIWLRVKLGALVARTERRGGKRPLLAKGNVRETLKRLMEERDPLYAEADLTVDGGAGSPERTVDAVLAALAALEPVR